MEEDEILKRMTPLEFVNYLEEFFAVKGNDALPDCEVTHIIEMLNKVDKNQSVEPEQPDINYIPTITSPSMPNPNFVGMPENVCYCYKEKKEGK